MERLEKLVQEIAEKQGSLEKLDKEVNGIDLARLEKVVGFAKKGLTFVRIWETVESHNCDANCWHPDTHTYSDYKGVRILEFEVNDSRGNHSYHHDRKRLYFLDTGEFAVYHMTYRGSHWQGAWETGEQEFLEILTLQDVVENFDVDDILDGFQANLVVRLDKLGERSKTQHGRLEKLRGLQI